MTNLLLSITEKQGIVAVVSIAIILFCVISLLFFKGENEWTNY